MASKFKLFSSKMADIWYIYYKYAYSFCTLSLLFGHYERHLVSKMYFSNILIFSLISWIFLVNAEK